MSENPEEDYGRHFGRLDLDRVGFFDDTPPGPQGEYRPARPDGGLRADGSKGRQMRARDGQCRFADPKFRRIFEAEALAGMTAPGGRREKKKKPVKIEGVLMPPGAPKHHSTPGDWYGCLGPQPESFSPEMKPELPRQKVAPNFSTSPNPKGGSGYLKICINPYLPRYPGWEPYEEEVERKKRVDKMQRDFVTTCRPLKFFTENPYHPHNLASASPSTHSRKSKSTSKLPALPAAPTRPVHRFYLTFPRAPNGPYSSCFARFPRYLIDPYRDHPPALRPKPKSNKPWRPTGRPVVRAKFTESVVEKVTRIACNSNNFADYREQVYPLY